MYFKRNSKTYLKFSWVLNLLSFIFKVLSFLNLKLKSIRQKKYSKVKIISVNNLSFGGTGKTTTITELGNKLEQNKIKFCIITRGYKSKNEKKGIEVLPDHTADQVGDEAKLLKENFPSHHIFSGSNKHALIKKIQKKNLKVILLDDGFQSTDIYKDISVMLLNPDHPFYYLRNFKFMINKETYIYSFKKRSSLAKHLNQGIYNFHPDGFYDINNTKITLENSPVIGFSALGDNKSFKEALFEFNLLFFQGFKDHFKYTQKDINELNKIRQEKGASFLICTKKDFVKLKELDLLKIPLLYLHPKIIFKPDLIDQVVRQIKED